MEKRGGGILEIELVDKTDKLANYYTNCMSPLKPKILWVQTLSILV